MLRHILVSTGIVLDTVILCLTYILLSPIDFKGKIFDFLSRNWSKIILLISGVKVKIIGIENINDLISKYATLKHPGVIHTEEQESSLEDVGSQVRDILS
jgi:hypothetical protein